MRVHPELLHGQKLPPQLVTDDIWKERFEDVKNIERYLGRNGVAICKFFLHVSKGQQKKRFLERLQKKDKNWKFSMGDAKERNFWDDYQHAYEDMIQHTASDHAPWYVVPADNKWFTRLVVAGAIIDALENLDLHYPAVDDHKREELRLVQAELERQGNGSKKASAKKAGDTASPKKRQARKAAASKAASKAPKPAKAATRKAVTRRVAKAPVTPADVVTGEPDIQV